MGKFDKIDEQKEKLDQISKGAALKEDDENAVIRGPLSVYDVPKKHVDAIKASPIRKFATFARIAIDEKLKRDGLI